MKFLTVLKLMLFFASVNLEQDLPSKVAESCCNHGQSHAMTTSNKICSGVDISDIALEQINFEKPCRSAAKWCCEEELQMQDDCSIGVGMAYSNLCGFVRSNVAKKCCYDCLKGQEIGKAHSSSACDDDVSSRKNNYYQRVEALGKQATYKCCMNAADVTDEERTVKYGLRKRELQSSYLASTSIIATAIQYSPSAAFVRPSPTITKSQYVTYTITSDVKPLQTVVVPDFYNTRPKVVDTETESNEISGTEPNTGIEGCDTSGECITHFATPYYDECKRNGMECGPEQQCKDLDGEYPSCQCQDGYEVDGQDCEDIDECSNDDICSDSALCVNTAGSYRCECPSGYYNSLVNNDECVDVDECSEAPTMCEHGCENVEGGYYCYCNEGYQLSNDNSSCEDIDECQDTDQTDCEHSCENTDGSYECTCPSGYRLDENGKICLDIDECEPGESDVSGDYNNAGEAPCGQELSDVCINTSGGYYCFEIECPPEYTLEDRRCRRNYRCFDGMSDCYQDPEEYNYKYLNIAPGWTGEDLFTWREMLPRLNRFYLRLVNVDASSDLVPADISCFRTTMTDSKCIISLDCELEGPQLVELELTLYLKTRMGFPAEKVIKVYIMVSEYPYFST